jgi:hypothetical protein
MFGVFRVKNHDFTPKNQIFSNLRGRDARRVRPPPLDPPLEMVCSVYCQTFVNYSKRSLKRPKG